MLLYIYKKYTSSILKTSKKDESLLVKLESVKNEPKKVLKESQKFLDVEVVEGIEIPRQNSSFPQDDPPELDNIDYFWMNLVAGGEMKKKLIKEYLGETRVLGKYLIVC